MSLLHVIILSIIQGLAELLPVSSSAHVVVAEKLMGMNPSSPAMTLLLVMLHTGTMLAVIVYFWQRWHGTFFRDAVTVREFGFLLVLATACTGLVGEALVKLIERFWFHGAPNGEVEQLFSHLELIAPALAAAGVLILAAGILERQTGTRGGKKGAELSAKSAWLIGTVQGVCLPFRGFSRSGATISAGMLAGVKKALAEDFSFALAVVLTPAADVREVLRLISNEHAASGGAVSAMLYGLLGAFCAFAAGLFALKWLSRWLESGRWYLFGIYCLLAAGAVALLHRVGY